MPREDEQQLGPLLQTAAIGAPDADDVLRAIRRIVQRITTHSKQLYRQSGLTVTQLLCLSLLHAAEQDGEVTATDLSRRMQLSPATVTGILDRLERNGWLRRERRSRDRRKVALCLTDKGRQRVLEKPLLLQERFVSRFLALPAAERQALLSALEKVVELMEAGDIPVSPILASSDEQSGVTPAPDAAQDDAAPQ